MPAYGPSGLRGFEYPPASPRLSQELHSIKSTAAAQARKNLAPLLQVNATGVMPVIFSSSLLAVPSALARYANIPALESAARALAPNGPAYLPVSHS